MMVGKWSYDGAMTLEGYDNDVHANEHGNDMTMTIVGHDNDNRRTRQ